MGKAAQVRAIRAYQSRQGQRGMVRFKVQALDSDRALIRALAWRLAENGPDAERARAAVRDIVVGETDRRGGILRALRRSPLVGLGIVAYRAREEGPAVDL